MSVLWQDVLVAVLVAGSALFSAWRLASLRLRLRALEALGASAHQGISCWLLFSVAGGSFLTPVHFRT